jgi:hypothetical protein
LEAAGVASVGKRKAAVPLLVVLVAGIAGALGAVAGLGHGSVKVTPFTMDLSVTPAVNGTTTVSMKAPQAPSPGKATATTHKSPIAFGVTITGIDTAGLAKTIVPSLTSTSSQPLDPTHPDQVLRYIEDHDRSALMAFAAKVGGIALAGGFAASLLLSLGNFKRAVLGAIAGVLVLGIIAFVAKTTYDASAFTGTRFTPAATSK